MMVTAHSKEKKNYQWDNMGITANMLCQETVLLYFSKLTSVTLP